VYADKYPSKVFQKLIMGGVSVRDVEVRSMSIGRRVISTRCSVLSISSERSLTSEYPKYRRRSSLRHMPHF
jgi:hypothetical protein